MGVDPYSRRFMWDYIRKITADTAIVLTTHNMEEGEALCDKLGIIVNGKMVCIGSNQDLKNRFMVGYVLALSCKSDVQGNLINEVQSRFPDALLTDQDAFRLKFSLNASVSGIFEIGEHLVKESGAQDFVVSQITLEDVFLTLTADQVDPDIQAQLGAVAANVPVAAR